MMILPSNHEEVRIPSNMKGTGFLRKKFGENKEFLWGLIDEKEFDIQIDTISKMTAEAYSFHRKKSVEVVEPVTVAMLALTSLMMAIYFFLIYYGAFNDDRSMIVASYFLFGISMLVTIVIGIINFMKRPDQNIKFTDLVRKSLLQYFDKLNNKFSKQGLSFNVYENHYWIEIKINPTLAKNYRESQNLRKEDYMEPEEVKENLFTQPGGMGGDTYRGVVTTDMDDMPLKTKNK